MFLNPNKMQFTTNFLMVEQLFKLKIVIEHIITDPKWTTFVNTMCATHALTSPSLKLDIFEPT